VQTDLLNNQLIDDPFYLDNEKKLQWIGKTDWEYQTTVNLTAGMLKRRTRVGFLKDSIPMPTCFSTISPKATDNMFRTWRANIKPLAKLGANTLRIHFRSPINEVLPVMAKMNYELPAANDRERRPVRTPEGSVPIWLGLGPAFRHQWHLASGFPRSLDGAVFPICTFRPKRFAQISANVTAEVEVIADANVDATVIVDDLTDKTIAAQRRVT